MDHERVPEHLAQTMDHLSRHWESRRKTATAHAGEDTALPFTITISREEGTQATAITREVANRLGWQVYDHELIEQIAQDMGVRTALLESVDERQQSWLLETAEAFVSAPSQSDWGPLVSESSYVHHLVKTVLALRVHGKCIIVGRGAAFILPTKTTLRVRLVGPVRERVAALSRQLGISPKDAAKRVRTVDRERQAFVENHFFKDPTDPRNYDLVLNAVRLSIGNCADLIVGALHRLQAERIDKPVDPFTR